MYCGRMTTFCTGVCTAPPGGTTTAVCMVVLSVDAAMDESESKRTCRHRHDNGSSSNSLTTHSSFILYSG